MTVYGRPSSVSAWPRIPGSPLKRCCQNAWPTSTTGSPPGRSSAAEKLRPSAGCRPSVGSSDAAACRPMSCSGSPRPVHVKALKAEQRQVAEHLLARCHLEVARMGEADARELLRLVRRAQPDEAIGLAIGERAQEHRVDDAEERHVGADAERQAEHGHQREPGRLEQLAGSVAKLGSHHDLPIDAARGPPTIVRRARCPGPKFGTGAAGALDDGDSLHGHARAAPRSPIRRHSCPCGPSVAPPGHGRAVGRRGREPASGVQSDTAREHDVLRRGRCRDGRARRDR